MDVVKSTTPPQLPQSTTISNEENKKNTMSKAGPIKPSRDIMPISKDDYLNKFMDEELRHKGDRERILSDMKSNPDSDSYITEEE